MNNQIQNQKTEVPDGIEMNDKDYLNELLSCLKNMEKNYALAMTEASNESLYQTYLQIFQTVSQMQRKTFELMFQKGWYVLEKAENQKITNKYNTLSQEQQCLNP